MRSLTVRVPTLNDESWDFDRLFRLWADLNRDELGVAFDFSSCEFLRPNAVAFLGGLSRMVEHRGGCVEFLWSTMQNRIQMNLKQNGFAESFGGGTGPWLGHSIPYREDRLRDDSRIAGYLRKFWLGRGWVNVSEKLRGAIVGRLLEIYDNAFIHAESPIGVFSCGQHFWNLKQLKLAVVDFGVGIPSNVRMFLAFRDPKALSMSAEKCLDWAFRPGTTTKPNGTSRGSGLDLLKNFIIVNKGHMEVFSHEGYGRIDGNGESYSNRGMAFEGTLFNITLRCDESYYQLASEAHGKPLF